MKPLLNIMLTISLLVTIFINPPANATNNNVSNITNAYLSRNITALHTIKAQLISESPYELAYVNYRLGLFLMLQDEKNQAEILLDQAENILTNKSRTNNSLDYSLLASVYSLKAGLGMISGAINGKKSSDSINKAKKLDQQNPQVFLVKGLSAYHTPGIFGGSNKKAMLFFNKAIALYDENKNKNVYWGFEEALVWRAILHKKNKQTDEAIKDLKRALSYNENFAWAKELLIKFSV